MAIDEMSLSTELFLDRNARRNLVDFTKFTDEIRNNECIKYVYLHGDFVEDMPRKNLLSLFQAIGSIAGLEEININFASVPVEGLILCLLQATSSLKILYMRRVTLTGTESDLLRLKQVFLDHSSLTNFHLCTCVKNTEPCIRLNPIIEAVASIQTIQEVYISVDSSNRHAAIELSTFSELVKSKSINRLSLLGYTLNYEHCAVLAKAMRNNSPLTYLHLSNANLNCSGFIHIADSLQDNEKLKSLCLASNQIGNDECQAMAQALKCNSTLEILDLHNNDLDEESASAIASALRINSGLKMIDLSGNKIGDIGLIAVANALHSSNKTLHKIYLLNCNLTNQSCIALGNALKMNRCGLKYVNLRMNPCITNDASEELVHIMQYNYSLEYLEIPINDAEKGICLQKKLAFYLKANRLGRKKLLRRITSNENGASNIDDLCCMRNDLDAFFYFFRANPVGFIN